MDIVDPVRHLNKLADMAVAAFCKILASLQLSRDLAAYRGNPRIQYLLGSHYRVNLHVGLHAGWSFEGAMGSEYKIDASYISPNVAVTAQVETATQHFKVPLLVTQAVLSLCSQGVVDYCRLIDNIATAGHPEPMELYCVDLDTTALEVDRRRHSSVMAWNPRTRYKVRQFLEAEKTSNWANQEFEEGLVYQTLYIDDDISRMRERYCEEFVQTFRMGFCNYQQGEWRVAHRQLIRACKILGERDGPSESILDFMQQRQFEAPADWQGHRDLEPLLVGPPQTPPRPDRFPRHISLRSSQASSGKSIGLRSTSEDKESWERKDEELMQSIGLNLPKSKEEVEIGLNLPNAMPEYKGLISPMRHVASKKDLTESPLSRSSTEEAV